MIGFLLCLALSLLQYPIEDYTYPQPQIPYESQVIEGSVIEGHVVGESIIEDATLQDRSISIVDGETSDPKTSDSFGQQSNNTAPSIDLSDVDAAFDQANPDHVSTTPEKTEVDSALAANELLAPAVLESDTNQQDTEALATSDSTTLLGMTIPNWGYYTLLAIPILGIAVIVLRGGRRSKSTPRRIRNSHVPTPQLEDAPASLGDHDSSGDHACTKSASGRTLAQRGMSIKGLREARKLQTANPDTASFDAIADAASEARNGRVLIN